MTTYLCICSLCSTTIVLHCLLLSRQTSANVGELVIHYGYITNSVQSDYFLSFEENAIRLNQEMAVE
jgi:hypothetical protein